MRIGHLEIFVRDAERSRRFYEEVLGFRHIDTQGGLFVWLGLGDDEILLRPGSPPVPADDYAGASIALVVYTDDLPATRERMRINGLELRGSNGGGCVMFQDPDGNWIQLVDPRTH